MNDALGYALELEGEGDIYAAARICRGALRQSPGDARAAALFARLPRAVSRDCGIAKKSPADSVSPGISLFLLFCFFYNLS